MSDFRVGMSGACMVVKYLKPGILPEQLFVDPQDGSGWVKYIPEKTCKFIPFVEEDGSIIIENCSLCDTAVLARCEYNHCPGCGAKVVER